MPQLLRLAVALCLFVTFTSVFVEARTLTNEAVVARIREAFDKKTIRAGLDDIRYFKEAGFIYQPALTVPRTSTCPVQEDWDQKAVMSGMVAADRSCAFLFGTYADVKREGNTLRKLLPDVKLPQVTKAEEQMLQKAMDTPQGREMLADRLFATMDKMLAAAARDEQRLRFLAAHLYGDLVERCYLAGIMVLAASESGTLAPLYHVHVDSGRKLEKALLMLSEEKLIGSQSKAAERAKKLHAILRLVSANGHKPSLNNLRKLVAICQEERSHYIVPCE